MQTIRLKPGRAKPLWKGHPWVFADSVARVDGAPQAPHGDWVRVADAEDRTVGHGFLSSTSAIRVRLLVRGDDTQDADAVLEQRIGGAAALRARLFPDGGVTDAYRLVHAEGDGLPGLVVDRLGSVLVAQFATRPVHARRAALAAWLLAASGAKALVGRAAGFEDAEGIEAGEEFVAGAAVPDVLTIREGGMLLEAAPRHAQKTGHYADQRENRLRVADLAQGLDVLDLYAGTGGFALQALRHGARGALAIDASARSVETALFNATLNGVAERFEMRRQDARAALDGLRAARRRFGLVVVDPPNFFPRRGPAHNALKAYRDVNVRALSRVAPGGFLATFCCSARLDAPAFLDLVRSAARECRRDLAVLRELAAGPDHPVSAGLPEGRYLSGLLLRVVG